MELTIITTADASLDLLRDLLDPADSVAGAAADSAPVWLTFPWCTKVILLGLSRQKVVVPTLDFWRLSSRGGYLVDFGPASDPDWRFAVDSIASAAKLSESLGSRSLIRIS